MKTTNLKHLTLLGILFLAGLSVFSQGRRNSMSSENREKIETHKIAYITDKLDLSSEEAQQFWPIYNAHRDKMNEERKQFKENYKVKTDSELSDDEAKAFLGAQMDHEQKMLDFRRKYYENLESALSPQKIVKLVEVEKKFREELIREVSRRHRSHSGQGQGQGQGKGQGQGSN